MDKYAILGELFYIIANYEKGRVKSSGIWGPRYIASLKKSLYIMDELLLLLKSNESISADKMLPIFDFIKHNTGKIFPVSSIDISSFYEDVSKIILTNSSHCIDCDVILDLMTQLVLKCISLLACKEKRYKIQIAYLLQALHNLPKIFLNPDQHTLFGIGIKSISSEDALHYSISYIKKANIEFYLSLKIVV